MTLKIVEMNDFLDEIVIMVNMVNGENGKMETYWKLEEKNFGV